MCVKVSGRIELCSTCNMSRTNQRPLSPGRFSSSPADAGNILFIESLATRLDEPPPTVKEQG